MADLKELIRKQIVDIVSVDVHPEPRPCLCLWPRVQEALFGMHSSKPLSCGTVATPVHV